MLNDSYRHPFLKRIDKNTAKKLWCKGKMVFLLPGNITFSQMKKHPPYGVSANQYTEEEFDAVCAGYAKNHCEKGATLHFYAMKEDVCHGC